MFATRAIVETPDSIAAVKASPLLSSAMTGIAKLNKAIATFPEAVMVVVETFVSSARIAFTKNNEPVRRKYRRRTAEQQRTVLILDAKIREAEVKIDNVKFELRQLMNTDVISREQLAELTQLMVRRNMLEQLLRDNAQAFKTEQQTQIEQFRALRDLALKADNEATTPIYLKPEAADATFISIEVTRKALGEIDIHINTPAQHYIEIEERKKFTEEEKAVQIQELENVPPAPELGTAPVDMSAAEKKAALAVAELQQTKQQIEAKKTQLKAQENGHKKAITSLEDALALAEGEAASLMSKREEVENSHKAAFQDTAEAKRVEYDRSIKLLTPNDDLKGTVWLAWPGKNSTRTIIQQMEKMQNDLRDKVRGAEKHSDYGGANFGILYSETMKCPMTIRKIFDGDFEYDAGTGEKLAFVKIIGGKRQLISVKTNQPVEPTSRILKDRGLEKIVWEQAHQYEPCSVEEYNKIQKSFGGTDLKQNMDYTRLNNNEFGVDS